MITEIGITAGDIWRYLDEHGKSTLSQIVRGMDVDKDRIFMSIGWLAREGHIIMESTGSDYQVHFRK